tara:strand:- start:268 stop:2478 length:2211 start_codon:yes stop_codon:yes gene_type:complete
MAIDVKFTNNARTLLSTSSVSTSATSISVDDGSVFPSLSGSSYFYATLQRASDSTVREIVKVTARSSNDLTIVRAQDNTSALTFAADDIIELRVVAKAFEDIITDVDLKSTASSPDFSGPISIAPSENTTKVLTVTVASKTSEHPFDSGSSNAYFIDGVEAPYLLLTPDTTYRFDQADASNDGHPFRFYYESDKTTAYSTGVTTNGTPGNAGAYTEIKATEATPTVLHYQCSSHALMGNKVSFIFRTDENIQDIVGSMFSSNTETGITATYQDSDGTIDLVVDTSATTETLTNKTFDVEGTGNSISNIDVADLKSGVLDTDISSVSGSDDTLASAKAVKTYVDAQIATKDNTDEITEGSSNLYFTNARADARITNALKDEDDMASDSATHVPSQQSVKAYVDAQDAAIASDTLTFTNKTFDVEGTGNSISNIDVADLKSGVLDTDISSVSSSDDTLASAKAIKTYVDANAGATALDDIGTGDAASTLATSSGNITIDAQGSDTDIIFKGTAGSTDVTMLTLDGSASGTASFNHDVNLTNSNAYINHRGAHFNASYGYNFLTYAGILFRSTASGIGVPAAFQNSAGTTVGYISTNNSNTSYITFSDYRLKKNVVNIADGISRLKQLKPRRFNFEDSPTQDGFLAHEVESIVPEAVVGTKDGMIDTGTIKDKDGNVIGTEEEKPKDLHVTGFTFEKTGETEEYQFMENQKLVPLLTAALQEAIAKIEALEARVTTLEG